MRWMYDPPKDKLQSFGCWDPRIDTTVGDGLVFARHDGELAEAFLLGALGLRTPVVIMPCTACAANLPRTLRSQETVLNATWNQTYL